MKIESINSLSLRGNVRGTYSKSTLTFFNIVCMEGVYDYGNAQSHDNFHLYKLCTVNLIPQSVTQFRYLLFNFCTIQNKTMVIFITRPVVRFILPYFSELMEKGSSLPWSETLSQAIGESRLSGAAMREYFRPLEDWLRNENLRTQEFVGWVYDGDYCKQSIETAGLQVHTSF